MYEVGAYALHQRGSGTSAKSMARTTRQNFVKSLASRRPLSQSHTPRGTVCMRRSVEGEEVVVLWYSVVVVVVAPAVLYSMYRD